MIYEKSVNPGSITPLAFARVPGPYGRRPVSAQIKAHNESARTKLGPPLVNVADSSDPHVYFQVKNLSPNEELRFQLKINYGLSPVGQEIVLIDDWVVRGSASPELPFTIESEVIDVLGTSGGGGGATGVATIAQPGAILATGISGGGGGGYGTAIILQAGVILGAGASGGGGGATGQAAVLPPGIVLGVGVSGAGGGATGQGIIAAVTTTPILAGMAEAEMEGDTVTGRVIKSDGSSYVVGTTWQYRVNGGSWTNVTGGTALRITGDQVAFDLPVTAGNVDQAYNLELRATEPNKDQSATGNLVPLYARAANSVTVAHPFVGDELIAAGWTRKAIGAVFRLFATYTGPCLRVRRLSDNTTLDVGFDANHRADEAAILAFIGNASATAVPYLQAPGTSTGTLTTVPAGLSEPLVANSGVLIRDPQGNLMLHFDSATRVISLGTGHSTGLSDYFYGGVFVNLNAVQCGYDFTTSSNQDTVVTKDGRSIVIQGQKARRQVSTPTTANIMGFALNNLYRSNLRFGGETLADTLSATIHANAANQATRETVRQNQLQFNARALQFLGHNMNDAGSELIANGTTLHTTNQAAHTPSLFAGQSGMEVRINQGFSTSWGGGSGGGSGVGGNLGCTVFMIGSRMTDAMKALAGKLLHQLHVRRSLIRVPVATEVFDFTSIVSGNKIDGVGTDLTLTGAAWTTNSSNVLAIPGLTGPLRSDTFTSAVGFANRFVSDANFGTAYPNAWTGPGKLANEFTWVLFFSTPATAYTSGDIFDIIALSLLPVGTNNGENTRALIGRDHTTLVSWTRYAGMPGDIFAQNTHAGGAFGGKTNMLGGRFQCVLSNVSWNSTTRVATANCPSGAHGLANGTSGTRDIVDPFTGWSGRVTVTAVSQTQVQWSVPAGKIPNDSPPQQICLYKNDKDEVIPANQHTGHYVNKAHLSQEQNEDHKLTYPMLTNQAYCAVLKHRPSPGQDRYRSTLELSIAQMYDPTGFGAHAGWRTYKHACARRAAIETATRWVDSNGLFLAAFDGWRHGFAMYDHWLSPKQANAVLLNGINLNNLKAA